MAESSVSVVQTVFVAVLRACCIVFGGTAVAYLLADRIDGTSAGSDQLTGYWAWFGDALDPSTEVTEALGNTLVMASAAVLAGALLGLVVGALLRSDRIGPLFGFLAIPTIAVAVPGFALYPLAFAASEAGVAPMSATPIDESLGDGLRFLGLWGGLVGLAVAPAMALVFAGEAGRRRSGLAPAEALSAARPEPRASWRFGFPTTSFLISLSAAELLSGQRGLFSLFFDALTANDLIAALNLTLWVVIAGSVLAIAVDLASRAIGTETPGLVSADAPPALRKSRAVPALLAAAAALVVLAVVGELLSDPLAVNDDARLASPRLGGPWLGRDELGRSTLTAVTSGLGSTLIAGLAPGLVAGAVGLLIASLLRRLPSLPRRLASAAVDLAWWPTPLLIPLVIAAAGIPDRPELNVGVILMTGAALTPLAVRLMGRKVVAASDGRWRRLLSAWLSCSAIAASISLLVGFAGLGRSASGADSTPRTNLGALMAEGVAQYDLAAMPLLAAALASAVLIAMLYGLAAALTAPDPTPVGFSGAGSWRTEPDPDEIELASVSLSVERPPAPIDLAEAEPAPPLPSALDAMADAPPVVPAPIGRHQGRGRTVDQTGEPIDGEEIDQVEDVQLGAAERGDEVDQQPITSTTEALGEPEGLPWAGRTGSEESPVVSSGAADAGLIDLRQDEPASVESQSAEPDPVDAPLAEQDPQHIDESDDDAGSGGDDVDEDEDDDDDDLSDIMVEATKTIELRPSTLRAAGIAAPVMPDANTGLSSGWSKPILAPRPAPAAPSEDNNAAARQQPDEGKPDPQAEADPD